MKFWNSPIGNGRQLMIDKEHEAPDKSDYQEVMRLLFVSF
jgi:hypothetical protein